MSVKIEVERNGTMLDPHWYGPTAEPDRFGKRGGYRVTPPGQQHNIASESIFYKSLDDVAQHLRANPDWGLRFSAGTTPSIFVKGILIDGKPR